MEPSPPEDEPDQPGPSEGERPEGARPERDASRPPIRRDGAVPDAGGDAGDDGGLLLDAGRDASSEGAHDAGAREARDAARGDARPADGGASCQLEGAYALRSEVQISWDGWAIAGLPILSPGEGTFTMDALSILKEREKEVEVSPCDVSIPDFQTERSSLVSELYGADVPQGIWERPSMPTWRTTWGATCFEPGCTVFTGAISAVVGARVTSEPFSWPGPRDARTGFEVVDDDGDGFPGITLNARGPMSVNADGRPYSYPPLVVSLFARARKIMMAMGMRSQIEGKLEDCRHLRGDLAVVGVYGRTLGCSGYRGEEEFVCEPQHVRFLDENMPVWKVKSATFTSTKIDEASCAAVRAELSPRPSRPTGE